MSGLAGYEGVEFITPSGHASVELDSFEAVVRPFVRLVGDYLVRADLSAPYPWADGGLDTYRSIPSNVLTLDTAHETETVASAFGAHDEDGLLERLGLTAGANPASSIEAQMLRDVSVLTPEVAEAVAATAIDSRESAAIHEWREARRAAFEAVRSAHTPEHAGRIAANELRRGLGLDDQPMDLEGAARTLGVNVRTSNAPGGTTRMVVGAAPRAGASATVLKTPRTSTSWGHRFEVARALGHVLLDPVVAGALGAAASPVTNETRRRTTGAFAAELLLPESAIARLSDGVVDDAVDRFATILEQYQIGAQAAANQPLNRGWLSGPDVRDGLIDAYAAIGPAG